MALPSEPVRASKGGYLSSFCCFTPAPVFAEARDVAASVADGKLVLTPAEGEGDAWSFELYLDAEFAEVEETVGGAASPSLYCKFSKSARRDDPTKLHFGTAEERAAWKEALLKARDEAARQ